MPMSLTIHFEALTLFMSALYILQVLAVLVHLNDLKFKRIRDFWINLIPGYFLITVVSVIIRELIHGYSSTRTRELSEIEKAKNAKLQS